MAGLVELLGEKLLGKSSEVSTRDALAGKKAIALYFSGHWCPPCRGFTPKLAEWYTKDLAQKGVEVVFVSSDKDDAAFKEYFGEMPWLALPFQDREKKAELDKKYKVQGIPSVVVIGPDGELITKDGRAAISGDPTGEEIPWKAKSFDEIFSGAKLVGSDGTDCLGSSLKGKVFGLYFSAHWCPPCRGFTPKLAEWYTKDLKGKGFEIVFISSDRDDGAFKEYFGEQPWLALDFADRKRKEQLSNKFGIEGIPSFVVIDADGSVITKDGREAVSGDPTGTEFPWYPKPVKNLKAGPGNINEVPTVLVFCETSDKETQNAFEAALTPHAKKYIDEAKVQDNDPALNFVIVTETSGMSGKIRGMLGLTQLPPGPHEHPLELKEGSGGWGCDGCGQSGAGKERYRCTAGCDFDFCGECNAKANGDAKSSVLPAKMMLVDIPDSGGFYEGPEGDVTTATLDKFGAEYMSKDHGTLERKQLS
jgi:nucleoredoxin